MSKPNPIRRAARQLFNRSIGLVAQSSTPYATHMPILCAIGAIVEPAHVVEFGSGLISTCGFQNRAAFPSLVRLQSFENDREWYESVKRQVDQDTRIELMLVHGPIKGIVGEVDLTSVDLIFVDDSRSHEARAETVTKLAAFVMPGTPVVIHDFEHWRLRLSAHRFDHFFRVDAFNPQTGIAWNGNWPGKEALFSANRLMKERSLSLPAGDLTQWAGVFRTRLQPLQELESVARGGVGKP
jgi:hypothetical protein